MNILDSFAIIILAAFTQASFQLSVSILTLMSGHALGRKTAHKRLLRLIAGYVIGIFTMTALLISFGGVVIGTFVSDDIPAYVWAGASGVMIGVGIAVWTFYFRKQRGTALWTPRSMAVYLSSRARATKNSAEAFGLGLVSVIGELLFSIAPIIVASLVIFQLEPVYQLAGILAYAAISILPLLVITALVGGGHSVSKVQKWREQNKAFIQFAAGSTLIILGVYLYVDEIVSAVSSTAGVVLR